MCNFLAAHPCQLNNGGCDQLCLSTPIGYRCQCKNNVTNNETTKRCETGPSIPGDNITRGTQDVLRYAENRNIWKTNPIYSAYLGYCIIRTTHKEMRAPQSSLVRTCLVTEGNLSRTDFPTKILNDYKVGLSQQRQGQLISVFGVCTITRYHFKVVC